jgi:hypothetical protein
MSAADPKTDLHRYLQAARDAVLWTLEGLSEYDVRRPLVPTGTNLLGLVKHLVGMEIGYLGMTFDRPFPDQPSWFDHMDEPNIDMWATEAESRDYIVDLYHRACAHSDATIEALPLDATGRVPWWPDDLNPVTLHEICVRVISETSRHAGHGDIVRELIDGSAGSRAEKSNMPAEDAAWWAQYRDKLERVARAAHAG